MPIGNNIRKLLDARKENISQFSRHADISYGSAFDLYHGKTKSISFDQLEKLCRYFGVNSCELFPYISLQEKETTNL